MKETSRGSRGQQLPGSQEQGTEVAAGQPPLQASGTSLGVEKVVLSLHDRVDLEAEVCPEIGHKKYQEYLFNLLVFFKIEAPVEN